MSAVRSTTPPRPTLTSQLPRALLSFSSPGALLSFSSPEPPPWRGGPARAESTLLSTSLHRVILSVMLLSAVSAGTALSDLSPSGLISYQPGCLHPSAPSQRAPPTPWLPSTGRTHPRLLGPATSRTVVLATRLGMDIELELRVGHVW